MSETTHQYGYADARVRDISVAQLLGQVMFLVAIALGFCALGTLLGRDLSLGTARLCSFAGFGMLLVSSFAGERFRVGAFAMGWLFATALLIGLGLGPVIAYFASVEEAALTQAAAGTAATVLGAGARFRVGAFAMGWLFATALVIGLGLGPVIAYYASVEPNALTQAFAGTAATVAGAGALGFVLSKDLARWMRPLSLIVFAACCGTIVWTLFAGSISPVVSLLNIFSGR